MSPNLTALGDHDDPALYETEEDSGQEATSLAPIEDSSPLGYNVNFFNATMLNVSVMIGMGIFSTPSFILRSVGSVGMLIALYIIVPFFTMAGLMVYIELTSMCGHKRSGAEVVYLEEAYPKPRYLLSTTFAFITALLNHAGVGATVFAKHVLHAFDAEITPFRQRSIALVMASCAIGACMLGWTAVPNSGNLKHPFEGSRLEANPLATAIAKVLYSYVGWNAVLALMAEVKGRNPVRTIQRAGVASLLITATLFVTTIVSFSLVLTKEEMMEADEVLGALFIRKVYGDRAATKLFPIFIGISAFGGIVSMTMYYGRMLREAGRQGVLPFATFWTRVGRFKTPYGPVLLKLVLTSIMILVIPASDTFAFLIDLASYPALVRLLYRNIDAQSPHRIPPKHGGDVGFFYATYCIVGILLLLLCGFYYWVRFSALPQWYGYELVEETVSLPGGVRSVALKKVFKQREGEGEPLLSGRGT
ncbi:High-affinity methionine permease [Ceratobasidium theobromae]|uniref:High-affinity methionine permease n=1 Tax=Ceratobasidium theobromae TaxID=1582974 RepID=A0A5N5QNF3_9AGAM|nr:High-affinity methionine permease [Ceratobasidium theobromae]